MLFTAFLTSHFFLLCSLKAGMRSYFNGGGSTSSATPPPSLSGRTRGSTGQIIGARSSSASLPRSPESDLQAMLNVGGSSGSGQGSLGSHGSNQEVYVNIYPSVFVSALLTIRRVYFFVLALFQTVWWYFEKCSGSAWEVSAPVFTSKQAINITKF